MATECRDHEKKLILEGDLVTRHTRSDKHYKGERCIVTRTANNKLNCGEYTTNHTCNKYKRVGPYTGVESGVHMPQIPTVPANESIEIPWWFIPRLYIYFIYREENHGGDTQFTNYYYTTSDYTRPEFNVESVPLTQLTHEKQFSGTSNPTTIIKNINTLDFYLEIQSEDYLKAALQKIFDHW